LFDLDILSVDGFEAKRSLPRHLEFKIESDLVAVVFPASKVDRTVPAPERAIDITSDRVVGLRDVEPDFAPRLLGLFLGISLPSLVHHQLNLTAVVPRYPERTFEIVHLDLPRARRIIEGEGFPQGLFFFDRFGDRRNENEQQAENGNESRAHLRHYKGCLLGINRRRPPLTQA